MLKLPYEILIQIFDIARQMKTINNSALSSLDKDFQQYARCDRFKSIVVIRETSKKIKALEKYLMWSKKNNLALNLSEFVKSLTLMSRKIEPKALTLSNLALTNLKIDAPEKQKKVLDSITSVSRIESWVVNIFDFIPRKYVHSIKTVKITIIATNFVPFLNQLRDLSVDKLEMVFLMYRNVHQSPHIQTGAFKSIKLESYGEQVPLDWIFTSHATLTNLKLDKMIGTSDKTFIDQLCKFTALEKLDILTTQIDIGDMYNALKGLKFMQSIKLNSVEIDQVHLPTLSKLLQLRFKNNAPFKNVQVFYNCPLENQESQVSAIKELVELERSKCQSEGHRTNFGVVAKFKI